MNAISTFAEAHAALEVYNQNAQDIYDPDRMEHMRMLLAALGNPQDSLKVVHVAGTSGKTSTCYYAAALLQQTGAKVGLTVSPYVDEINDRLQINLIPLAEAEYCAALSEFLILLDKLATKPSYLEVLIGMAFWYFAREKVDYAVIEVGLGGLLDRTNVVTRRDKVCVITDIGFDHTHVLGKTLPKITAHKAGIILPGNTVFTYVKEPALASVVRERANSQSATLHEITFNQNDQPAGFKELPSFQRRNWQLAYKVSQYISERDGLEVLSPQQLQESIKTYVPGRMEIISYKHKTVILDGAHNPQKMATLVKGISDKYLDTQFAVLVAFKPTKDVNKARAILAAKASYVIDAQLDTMESGLRLLMRRKEPILVVTGSLYMLRFAREFIHGEV